MAKSQIVCVELTFLFQFEIDIQRVLFAKMNSKEHEQEKKCSIKKKQKQCNKIDETRKDDNQTQKTKADILAQLLAELGSKPKTENENLTNTSATNTFLKNFQSQIGPLDQIEDGNLCTKKIKKK